MTTEQTIFVRAYPSMLEQTGPRQLTGRLVPYDIATDVLDVLADGKPDIYREGFRRGAFTVQATSNEKGVLRRIGFIHKHDGGLGYLGPFTALREEDDGLWGDVRVLPTKADDVAALLEAGVDELSVEFRLPRGENTRVDGDGVRWRLRAHLDAVALEAKGAYTGARVLAFRAEQDALDREEADAQRTTPEKSAEEIAEEKAEAERVTAEAARKQRWTAILERDKQEAADAEAAAAAKLEADAAAAVERHRLWDELAARYDLEVVRQHELIHTYGVTAAPHDGLPLQGY